MKNLLLFAFCLLISGAAFGQGTETFTSIGGGTTSSYLSRNWTGDSGYGSWTATDSRIDQVVNSNNDALTVRDGVVTSPTITGGIGSLTLSTKRVFSGGSGTLTIRVDGVTVGTIAYDGTANTNTISNINISGSFVLTIETPGDGDRIAMDDLIWTGYSAPTTPIVGFDVTTSTTTEGTTNYNIPVTLSNYSSDVTLDITLGNAGSGNNTYEAGDVTLINNPTTLTFTNNGTQNVILTLNQEQGADADADDEVIEITITEQTATGITISTATHTLTITDDELPIAGDLVINEIHYNPVGSDSDKEFLELYNASGTALNIGGVTFTNGIIFTFDPGTTIDADEYIIIAANAVTYSGNGYDVYEYTGSLVNTGAQITIEDGNLTVIDDVTYGVASSWPTAPDGTGVTLSLNPSSQDATNNDNAASWGVSCAIDGTSGAANVNCSAESEIVAVAASEAVSISSLENTVGPLTSTDGVQVWQFTINEGGSDLTDDDVLPSIINSLDITAVFGEDGVTDWSEAIQSADLFDGSTHLATATIPSAGTLSFTGSPLVSVAEGSSKTLSLRISLGTNITQTNIDNSDFVFQITDSNIETPTDGTSSSFEFTAPQSTDGQNAIEVVGTALAFATQPTNTIKDAAMTDIEIVATDANGNTDEDFATNVSITSTGTLTGSPVSVAPVSGVATFSTLTHTATGTNLTLTAAATGFTNIISTTFDITSLPDLFISEVSDASSYNNEFLEIYNNSSFDVDLTGYKLVMLPDDDVFDFGTDETSSGAGSELIIPANGFLVITRGASESDFQLEFSSFPNAAAFNRGHGNLFFGATARRWRLRANDGTANTDDGTLIDDTGVAVGGDNNRDYQNAPGNWINSTDETATPGEFDAGQVLPVELLHFTAKANNQTTILTWSTATEENNAYFDIQRSTDGINFETIGQVEGAGTTYDVQEYSFIDESPVEGVNYYRLKQVDFDGQFEYHKIVMVNINGLEGDIAIVPTQVRSQFDVVITESINEPVEMNIISVNGQVVKSTIINMNGNRQTIEVSELNAGVYFVRLNVNNTIVTKRFVKL